MKTLTTLAVAAIMTLALSTTALADVNESDAWSPVKLKLTAPQQRLLESRADAGASVTVLPLTPGQEAFLSNRWDGWREGMITVHSVDRFDASDTVWVSP